MYRHPEDIHSLTHSLTHMVDNILSGKKDKSLTKVLKNAFGFRSTHDDDFANQLAPRIGLD